MGTPLTKDEEQVLKLAAEGRSIKEIAAESGISPDEVKTHLHGILPSCLSRRLTRRFPRPCPPLSLSRMSSLKMRSVGKLRERTEPERGEGGPRIHVVDSRQELIDSLSDDELWEVCLELGEEYRRRQPSPPESIPARKMSEVGLRALGPDYMRSVIATLLDEELPGVDLPALVHRARAKG